MADLIVGFSWRSVDWVLIAFQVFDNEVIQWEAVRPSILSAGEHHWCFERFEVSMVPCYEDQMIRSLEVITRLLPSLRDGQEHLVAHVIVLFCTWPLWWVHFDWSENPQTVILFDTPHYGEATCIGMQNNWLSQFERPNDAWIGQGNFYVPQCEVGIPSPFPFDPFRCSGTLCFLL